MPTTAPRRRRSYRRKRPIRRRRGMSRSVVPRFNLGNGIPPKVTTTLKYVERVGMTSTTGAMSLHAFSANGLFDPNITGTGHQPMYFDQLAALYNHYMVEASRIKVEIMPFNTTGSSSATFFVRGDDGGTLTSSNMYTNLETRGVKYVQCPIYEDNQVYVRKMSTGFSKSKTFGNNKNNSVQAAVGANPAEQWYYTIGAQSDDLGTTTTWTVLVTIVYKATFFELKDIASS